MSDLDWRRDPPRSGGVLLVACSGWNDAGSAASSAVHWIRDRFESDVLARVDPDAFFDYQAHRPTIEIRNGLLQSFQWPGGNFHSVDAPRPLITYTGDEPSHRWRAFTDMVIEVAQRCEVERIITFGSLLSDVPHTRIPPLTTMASAPELLEGLSGVPVNYQGPTGAIGALYVACAKAGIPTVSLWAPIPHYLSGTPQPLATMALVEAFAVSSGISVDMTGLDSMAVSWRNHADELVRDDPDAQEIVAALEAQYDADETPALLTDGDVPSGDVIAAELEAFLRENDEQ